MSAVFKAQDTQISRLIALTYLYIKCALSLTIVKTDQNINVCTLRTVLSTGKHFTTKSLASAQFFKYCFQNIQHSKNIKTKIQLLHYTRGQMFSHVKQKISSPQTCFSGPLIHLFNAFSLLKYTCGSLNQNVLKLTANFPLLKNTLAMDITQSAKCSPQKHGDK